MDDISIKNPLQSPRATGPASNSRTTAGSVSFGQMLKDSIHKVNQQQVEADKSIENLVTGKQTDIHQTMISAEKARISFELLMQIRNKVVSAYETIMRTPV